MEISTRKSSVSPVPPKQRRKLYTSGEYRRFSERVLNRLASNDPKLAALISDETDESKPKAVKRAAKTDDVAELFAPLARADDIEASNRASMAIKKHSAEAIAKPLVATLEVAAARKPEKN